MEKFLILYAYVVFFIACIAIVFVVPYAIDPIKYLSYKEWFLRVYGTINTPKTITFMTIYVSIFITIFILGTFSKIQNKILYMSISIFVIVSVIFLLLMPQHTALELYSYGDVKPPSKPDRFINFLFIGDIQEVGAGANRYERSMPQYNNLKRIIKEFPKYNQDQLQGLLTPGDCTQSGEDGRLYSNNYLADYEARWGLGTFNSLPIQVYECTGNHDWDASEEIWPRHRLYKNFQNPTVKMINRRNKYRYGITASDGYGNYEFIWSAKNEKYRLIFFVLNVHISNNKLLSGHPDNSINFLKDRLAQSVYKTDRYIVMTHFIDDSKPEDWETIKNIFGDKLYKVKAFLYGHWHASKLENNDIFFIGPSLDGDTDIVALFSYDTIEDKLVTFELKTDTPIPKIIPVTSQRMAALGTSEPKETNIPIINLAPVKIDRTNLD